VPKPDLVLLLDASGAAMHGRKGEYEPLELDRWRAAYKRLSNSSHSLLMIDAEQPPEAVRRQAQACIWRCCAERWRHR
jgi:thymidylate kinase